MAEISHASAHGLVFAITHSLIGIAVIVNKKRLLKPLKGTA